MFNLPLDSTKATTYTTDGKYIYYGNLTYYTSGNASKIYKIGTGNEGTIKGLNYGAIPNFLLKLKNQFFYYSDGSIYIPDSSGREMIKINPVSGDTTQILSSASNYSITRWYITKW